MQTFRLSQSAFNTRRDRHGRVITPDSKSRRRRRTRAKRTEKSNSLICTTVSRRLRNVCLFSRRERAFPRHRRPRAFVFAIRSRIKEKIAELMHETQRNSTQHQKRPRYCELNVANSILHEATGVYCHVCAMYNYIIMPCRLA